MTDLARYAADPAFTGTGFAVIDFEGLPQKGGAAEPIELGAVLLRPRNGRLECESRYEALIRPPEPALVTAAVTALTGITASMLTDRPAAPAALAGLDALLTRPPYVVVAHHAPTEGGILRRYAHACPQLAASRMIDTVRLARACWPNLDSYSLDALLDRLGITIPAGRHRALADALITAELFHRLLIEGATAHRWSRLAQLYDLAGHPAPAGGIQTALF